MDNVELTPLFLCSTNNLHVFGACCYLSPRKLYSYIKIKHVFKQVQRLATYLNVLYVCICIRNLGAQSFIPINKKARTSFREMRLSLHLQNRRVLKPEYSLNEVRRAKRDASTSAPLIITLSLIIVV